jgi:hypothetical protein
MTDPHAPIGPEAPSNAPAPNAAAPGAPGCAPAYAPAGSPAGRDTRPKTLALGALILAIVGLVISALGFLPLPVIGLIAAVLGGIALLVALVLGIIALAVRKHGGKGLSIAAIIVSVLGGIVWVTAIVASLMWTAFAVAESNGISLTGPTSTILPEDADDITDDGTTDADEQAYLDEVKPQIVAILQTINPAVTAENLADFYSDEDLVEIGEELRDIPQDQRAADRAMFVSSVVESSGGIFTEETAGRLFDAALSAADKHLD